MVVVLEAGGLLKGAEAHLLKIQSDLMKRLIKIRKRDDREVTHHTEISSATINTQRTTEMIVKGWIREARERSRATVNGLHDAIRQKEIGGIERG